MDELGGKLFEASASSEQDDDFRDRSAKSNTGWCVVALFQGVDKLGLGYVLEDQLYNALALTDDVASGVHSKFEEAVSAAARSSPDGCLTVESFTATLESNLNPEDLESVRQSMRKIAETVNATIRYTYEWKNFPPVLWLIVPVIVAAVGLSSIVQPFCRGPRNVTWVGYVVAVLHLPPYIWYCFPQGREHFGQMFSDWKWWTLPLYLCSGWLPVICIILLSVSDGTTFIDNDTGISTATTFSYTIWVATVITIALPSGLMLSHKGATAVQRERTRLSTLGVECPHRTDIVTAADVAVEVEHKVSLKFDRPLTCFEYTLSWIPTVFGILIFGTMPVWIRLFSFESRKVVLPATGIIYGLLFISNAFAVFAIVDNMLLFTSVVYRRIVYALRSLGNTVNAEKSAERKVPFLPLWSPVNAQAFIRLRQFFVRYYQAVELTRATYTMSMIMVAFVILVGFGIASYITNFFDILVLTALCWAFASALAGQIVLSALLVNESVDLNNREIQKEMLLQQSAVLGVEDGPEFDGLETLTEYFESHEEDLKILGVAITRSLLNGIRVAIITLAVFAFSFVQETLFQQLDNISGAVSTQATAPCEDKYARGCCDWRPSGNSTN